VNRQPTTSNTSKHFPTCRVGSVGSVDLARVFRPKVATSNTSQRPSKKRSWKCAKTCLDTTISNFQDFPPSTRGCRCRAIGPASLGGARRPGNVTSPDQRRADLHRLNPETSTPPRSGGVIDKLMRFIAAGGDRITVRSTREEDVSALNRISIAATGMSLDEPNPTDRPHPSRDARSRHTDSIRASACARAKRSQTKPKRHAQR